MHFNLPVRRAPVAALRCDAWFWLVEYVPPTAWLTGSILRDTNDVRIKDGPCAKGFFDVGRSKTLGTQLKVTHDVYCWNIKSTLFSIVMSRNFLWNKTKVSDNFMHLFFYSVSKKLFDCTLCPNLVIKCYEIILVQLFKKRLPIQNF